MPQRLTGRQLAIMQVLWARGQATVAEVREQLSVEHPLAYSTVATLLSRLERKGVVRHVADGRTYVYEPAISAERVHSTLVSDLMRRLFDGKPSQLVSYLLESEQVDGGELARIKQLLAEHEAATRASGSARSRGQRS